MRITSSLLNRISDVKETSGEWKVTSPARTDQIIGSCVYRYSDIELAVKGALDFPPPALLSSRIEVLKKAQALLRSKQNEIFSVAKSELGRITGELESEWDQCEAFLNGLLSDSSLSTEGYDPRGLTVVLGSYVWPIFHTLQFAFLNFIAGNPVILKPSEKATQTVVTLMECLREIQELKSIQVLVGEKEVGRRMATHEAVATVMFQGSFEMGMRVKQDVLSQPAKEVLLYLGSKNPAIVFADAAPETEAKVLKDAFWGAGQHCRSTSLIFVERARLASFNEKFHELSKTFKIGGPDSGAFMGPLIDGAMLDRYLKFIGISEREGAEVVMRGKSFTQGEKGHFVTPSIALFESVSADQMRKSVSFQTEILSPHVSIIGFDTEDELKGLMQAMTHGRLATLWGEDAARTQALAKTLPVGEVLVNASALETNPWLSTQARKRSGNHAKQGRDLLTQLLVLKTIHS